MHTPRQVPGIAQQRPGFNRSNLPPIASPMEAGSQQQTAEQGIAVQMNDLGMQIYSELALSHIRSNREASADELRSLASSAQTAAKAYFEALGVRFDG